MEQELPEFLRLIGNEDEALITAVTAAVSRIVKMVTTVFQKETAWVCMRATTLIDAYNLPRWHTDGSYYSPSYGAQYKFVASLKGKPTLFFPLNEEGRKVYRVHESDRLFLADYFPVDQAEFAKRGEGAFFIVSASHFSALHSEPPHDEPRLFISILPGHKCEIAELQENWLREN